MSHFESEIGIVERRVENARLQLEWAENYRQEIERDFASGLVDTRASEDTFQRAIHSERLAREHHQQALKTLNFLRRNAQGPEFVADLRHSEPHRPLAPT